MNRWKFSIAGMLAGIALFGVAFTALLHPSPLWANTFYSFTLATLVLVILGAIYGQGRRRAFRVGFATCGWVYFLTCFGPGPLTTYADHLVTNAIIEIVYPYTVFPFLGAKAEVPPARLKLASFRTTQPTVRLVGAFGGSTGPSIPPPTPWEVWTTSDRMIVGFNDSTPRMFRRIGHSLFCLACGGIGGLITRRFYDQRNRPESA